MASSEETEQRVGQLVSSTFFATMPKAELHVHLEGCLHPKLIQRLATRNGVRVNQKGVPPTDQQDFNLERFLEMYFDGIRFMITEQDFYEVVRDYANKVAQQNVMHVEMFFDPQAHLERGVTLQTIIAGVSRAADYAREELDISICPIMCFLREKPVDSAMRVLNEAADYKSIITGVGLDGDPTKSLPRDFKHVFQIARDMGFFTTAHCDKMPSDSIEQIRQALQDLKVDRLDHASCIFDDESLATYVADKRIGITCCPKTSTLLYHDIGAATIRQMLARGMKCSIHSDDPGSFGAYINDNLQAVSDEGLSIEEIVQLARNSIESSWATAERKRIMLSALDTHISEGNALRA